MTSPISAIRRLGPGALWAAGSLAVLRGAPPAPADSPFAPIGAYALVGVSLTPKASEVCIRTTRDDKTRWIGIGATVEGIHVLSFDHSRNEAAISAGGKRMILVLRQADGLPAANVASANADQPPAAALSQAAGRRASPPPASASDLDEQRMLVSDLLDIAAKQRAANAAAAKPSQ